MKKIIAVILLLSGLASASDLLGPVWNLKGKHVGDGEPLTWTIEYLDAWGRTVTDQTGGHFYHDRCCGGVRTDDPTWIYPKEYWGTTQMYYCGTTMRYRLTLTNNGKRAYRNLRVVAVQEYLNPTGNWGERIGPDAARDWYLKALGPNQSVTFEGTCAIPYTAEGGLDQTHLQVQHWTGGKGRPGPGSVIIDDSKAAIWCPPDQQTRAESAPTTFNSTTGTVTVLAGGRGFVEPGVAARFEIKPVGNGLMSLKIYDRNGLLVREVSRYTGGGIEVMGWDGLDAGGRSAVSGVYLAVITGPGIQARERVALLR